MADTYEAILGLDKMKTPGYGSIIELKDKRLMWVWSYADERPFQANYSADGGRTWSDPVALKLTNGDDLLGAYLTNLVRLPSGALALIQNYKFESRDDKQLLGIGSISFHKSEDEGQTWSPPQLIHPPGANIYQLGNDNCFVLKDGRLIVPAHELIGPRQVHDDRVGIYRHGQRFIHGVLGALFYSCVYYSDDEGRTWMRSLNETFAMLERGAQGVYSMCEPAVVELSDGRLLMFGRVNLGRVFQSISEDRGETWSPAEPTELATYPSLTRLKRIPQTSDLLVIWNQTSQWEMMNGLFRHRLTCAISKDDGKTWQNHKNLESLDDMAHVEPGPISPHLGTKICQPIDRERYVHAPGPLRCSDTTCMFLGDHAIITYMVGVFGDEAVITDTYGVKLDDLMQKWGLAPDNRGNKVRVLPIEWFYE